MEQNADLAFRQLLFEVSQKIRPEDAHNLAYVYQLRQDRGERRISETLDALVQLERKGFFSSSKPEGLVTILKNMERQDLAELVRDRTTKKGRQHVRPSPTDVSGQSAQEVAEHKVALALADVLQTQTQKLRGYPHQAVHSNILTTVIQKIDDVKQLLGLALDDLSALALDAPSPESGTYVYATKQLPTTSATTSILRFPIPETARQRPSADDCDGGEEHVYATVQELDMAPPLPDNSKLRKELLTPLSQMPATEFDRKSSARKAVRHHQPRSPLQSDSGSKSDEADVMSDATNPDSEPNDDVLLSTETMSSPVTSQSKQECIVPISAVDDNRA